MSDPVAARIVAKLYGSEDEPMPCLPLTPAELRLLRMALGSTRLGLRPSEQDDWATMRAKIEILAAQNRV